MHGLNTLEHQPAKIAAIEAHWEDTGPPALVLFAWPDPANERNEAEIAIPRLGALILTHDWNGRFKGLKEFPRQDRPPIAPVFFSFRAMVGLGFLMIAIGWLGCWLLWRKKIETTRWFIGALQYAWPVGFIALLSGWMVTEIGRQPWIAYGVLRTSDAVSPVTAAQVLLSLLLFVLVYFVVFSVGIWYISRMITKGPHTDLPGPETLPNRPLAGAQTDRKEGAPA
jgi:cytochrome d ubiquinol oxidase subunit I